MARRPQKARHDLVDTNASTFNFPAVSVIIPLFNVERYIGECLDSLLNQTFQNFEVIIVDDCSTDSSPGIVESYAPRFNGRLTLLKTRRNTGSGTEPRNLGLAYSRGEYVFFMDNDDAVTTTALDEMYALAKKYDADVVHCEKFYGVPDKLWNDVNYRQQLKPSNYLTGEKFLVNEPLLWIENFEERAKFFAQRKLIWNYWVQLIRREFLVRHSIRPVGIMADDLLFTMCELCCAARYVVVPNVIYFYRQREDSLYYKNSDVPKHVHSWVSMLKDGIRYLDGFWNEREPFTRRPDLRYLLLEMFTEDMLQYLAPVYAQIPAPALDELLRKEFAGGDDTALTTFFFSKMNIQYLQLMQAHQRLHALENELQRVRTPKQE